MNKREWPFKGDAPVARARKIAGAYRQVAEDLRAENEKLRDMLAEINPTLIKFCDHQLAGRIRKELKTSADSNPIGDLDARFYEWGEEWHAPAKTSYDPDDMVNADVAGSLVGLQAGSINRLRIRGRIKGHWTGGKGTGVNGHFMYLVKDVYALSSELRGRAWRTTDKVREQEKVRPHDGTSR